MVLAIVRLINSKIPHQGRRFCFHLLNIFKEIYFDREYYLTASFNDFPAVNLGTVIAGI